MLINYSQVHDSNAKLPSSLLRGNINQYGDFDQCLRTKSAEGDWSGEYCLAKVFLTVPETLPVIKHLKEDFVVQDVYSCNLTDASSELKLKVLLIYQWNVQILSASVLNSPIARNQLGNLRSISVFILWDQIDNEKTYGWDFSRQRR